VDPTWLEDLEAHRRVLRTRVAGVDAWAGVEDAARLRDGLGAPIPPGVASAHLRPVEDPLGDLIARYSRTHGPFTIDDVVRDLGLPPAVVAHRLSTSRAAGRVIEGWFVPDTPGPQWCHPDVLRLIKRRSVALLRQQIEPVSQAALATFLPRWQGIGRGGSSRLRGPDGVLDAIRAMAGVAVPASALEESLLPLRVSGYDPAMLDELTATGEVLWTGSAPLPGGDGWIALAPADAGFLLPRAAQPPGDPVARELLELLRSGGGWFLDDLRARMTSPDLDTGHLATGLVELLWAGLVSNDTIEPLRVMLDRSRARRRRSTPRAGQRPRRPPRGRYANLWRRPSEGGDGSDAHGSGWPTAATEAPGSPAPRARTLPELPGRWFALPADLPPAEVVAVARAEAHLDRLGIVTRGAVLASGDPGGFAAAYRTLSMMEERGRVQRVYAVEGLGASQFALTGVVDQVRAVERELAEGQAECLLLATADPANAYGAALEWPASDWAGGAGPPHRPSRAAGCHVVLRGGRPVLYAERGGHTLLTFSHGTGADADDPRDLATATRLLHDAVRSGGIGALTISKVNGSPVMELPASDPVRGALEAAGFGLTPRGYRVPR
jgi:ATP-dependent Lhr-like helicase